MPPATVDPTRQRTARTGAEAVPPSHTTTARLSADSAIVAPLPLLLTVTGVVQDCPVTL